jgi:hypothetical protein
MTILALVQVAVLLLLGLTALGVGVSVAVRPSERRFALLRPLTWATVFATLSAICGGLSATMAHLAAVPAGTETSPAAWAGLAEAMVTGVFGFGVLAVAWGLAAVGLRRQE